MAVCNVICGLQHVVCPHPSVSIGDLFSVAFASSLLPAFFPHPPSTHRACLRSGDKVAIVVVAEASVVEWINKKRQWGRFTNGCNSCTNGWMGFGTLPCVQPAPSFCLSLTTSITHSQRPSRTRKTSTAAATAGENGQRLAIPLADLVPHEAIVDTHRVRAMGSMDIE